MIFWTTFPFTNTLLCIWKAVLSPNARQMVPFVVSWVKACLQGSIQKMLSSSSDTGLLMKLLNHLGLAWERVLWGLISQISTTKWVPHARHMVGPVMTNDGFDYSKGKTLADKNKVYLSTRYNTNYMCFAHYVHTSEPSDRGSRLHLTINFNVARRWCT